MSLRIINLEVENYKGIRAIDITPKDDLVMITGGNGQGKSSVLDSIYAILCGGAASRVTQTPIHDGEDFAIATAKVGDAKTGEIKYIVTRRWKDNDAGTVTVMAPDGAKYSSPQKMLDEIIGKLSFDPFEFVGQSAKEQVETLIGALGEALPFVPAELDRKHRGIYDRRTDIAREITKLEGQLAQYGEPDPATPDIEESAADLLREVETARGRNLLHDQVEEAITTRTAAVEAARAVLADAEKSLDSALTHQKTLQPREDVDPILARLDGIEETNRKVRAKLARQAIEDELSDRRAEHANHTLELGKIDKTKADGLAAAKFPVDGLSFDEDGVTFNKVPFGQVSTSEQARVAMAIGMASNPELRVMRIDKGEALDSKTLALVTEMAADHDYQVWMSKVDESGTIGFVIEDGAVAA
jgi:DNA repair exonuclease SbcCD ATPase subunit